MISPFKFIRRHRKITIAIEIGKEWLKLALAEDGSKGKKLLKVATRRIEFQSDEAISETIKELLGGFKIKSASLMLSIPRDLVTARFLKLPSADETEIKNMVEFQAARQIPYPKDEIIVGYRIVKIEEGYCDIIMVIVHQDIVNNRLRIIKNIGLEPQHITLSSSSICNWYIFMQHGIKNKNVETTAVLDMDSSATDIVILSENNLIFTRALPLGIKHLDRKLDAWEDNRNKFIDEVRRSFVAYKEEGISEEIKKIVLNYPSAEPHDLDKTLEAAFSLPVESIDTLKDINVDKNILDDQSNQKASILAVLGLALNKDFSKINLLPVQIQIRQNLQAKRKNLLITGVLLLSILAVCLSIFIKNMYDKERYLDELKTQLGKISPLAKDVEQMIEQLKIIKSQLDFRCTSMDVLHELYAIIPSEISLSVFTFDLNDSVTLQGTSQNMSDVFKFITILEKSPYFKNIQIRYATKGKMKNKELTNFQIRCSLESQIENKSSAVE